MEVITVGFQWANWSFSLAILAVMAGLWVKHPDFRYLYVAPLIWAVTGIVFYSAVLFFGFTGPGAELWSAVHRFLAYILILGGAVALWIILRDGATDG